MPARPPQPGRAGGSEPRDDRFPVQATIVLRFVPLALFARSRSCAMNQASPVPESSVLACESSVTVEAFSTADPFRPPPLLRS